jgi:hypothetical protein
MTDAQRNSTGAGLAESYLRIYRGETLATPRQHRGSTLEARRSQGGSKGQYEDVAASFMMPGDLLCSRSLRQHAYIDSRRATYLT